jgi:hypothetical protein
MGSPLALHMYLFSNSTCLRIQEMTYAQGNTIVDILLYVFLFLDIPENFKLILVFNIDEEIFIFKHLEDVTPFERVSSFF